MNRTVKRLLTTSGATVGALALFTGTASAHYCANYSKNPDAGTISEVDLKNGKTSVRGAYDGANMERTSFPTQATFCGSADNGAVVRDEILALPELQAEIAAIRASLSCNQDAGAPE